MKIAQATRNLISTLRDQKFKGSGRLAQFLAHTFFPIPRAELAVDTIYGFKLFVNPRQDQGVERAIYHYGTYEKGTLNLMGELLKPGDLFVDVGANIGLMSIFASKIVGDEGRVYAFEPNPDTRSILNRNILLNEIKNIDVSDYALSNASKTSKIFERWEVNRGGATLIQPESPTNYFEVEETTFSQFFSNVPNIKLVKIDVEGYELEVLKGASEYLMNAAQPPALIVEFSENRQNSFGWDTLPLWEFLKSLGLYRFYKSTHGKERISRLVEIANENELPSHDNIYCLAPNHLAELPKKNFL